MSVSLGTSALLFPFLVWGGFVFLPFDAPLLDSAPLRLIYTLRCSVFAAAPIVLGEYSTSEEESTVSPVSPLSLTCLSLRLAGAGRHSTAVRCFSTSV